MPSKNVIDELKALSPETRAFFSSEWGSFTKSVLGNMSVVRVAPPEVFRNFDAIRDAVKKKTESLRAVGLLGSVEIEGGSK